MSLYERNSIHYSEQDKGEVIYVSYQCEDDEQYDYLLLSNINKVSLQQTSIKTLNLSTCNIDTKPISFECAFNKDIDNTNIEISASINDFNGTPVKVELQTFVDELAASIYENNTIEQSEHISKAKVNAIAQLQADYFNETGNIVSNFLYNVVGKIVDTNGNIVGIINNFNTCIENNKMVFTLNNCVSYIPLKDIDVSKIEFITGKAKLIINSFEIISSSEGTLKQYQIVANNAYSEETDEPIIAETIYDIYDDDFYFDTRIQLLSDKEKLFESTNVSNNVNDLFDDFDF